MPLQTIIREKRKELGLTQEQIADYLGVSTPAVNKWESGSTSPDISLLSPLARLLKTDVNTLLCFQEEITEQEVNTFSKEVMDNISQKGFDAGLNKVRALIEKYPVSYNLIHNLVLILEGSLIMSGFIPEDKKKYEVEINNLYERLLNSDDMDIQNSARFMLASKHINHHNLLKAQEIIDQLRPVNQLDKRLLQVRLFQEDGKLDEAKVIIERLLFWKGSEIWNHLLTLINLETDQGNIEKAYTIANICSQEASLLNFSDYYKFIPMLQVSAAAADTENTLKYLELILKSSEPIWSFSNTLLYKDVLVHENEKTKNISILPALINELETNKQFDFIKENDKFKKIIDKYKHIKKSTILAE